MPASRSPAVRLHALVRGLTPRERAHVKRVLGAHKADSGRAALFDHLKGAEAFDEAGLRAFAARRGLHRHSAVQGLYAAVLRAVRSMDAPVSPIHRLATRMADLEYLRNKGLLVDGQAWIREGLALAREREMPAYALQFRQWHLNWTNDISVAEHVALDRLDEELEDIDLLVEAQRSNLVIGHLAKVLDHVFEHPTLTFPEARALVERRILAHPLVAGDRPPRLPRARYKYWDLIASAHYYLEDWERCRTYSERLLEEESGRLSADTEDAEGGYRVGMLLCNLMNTATHLEDGAGFLRYATRFRALLEEPAGASDQALLEAYCMPRYLLQEARHAALTGRAGDVDRLFAERLFPVVAQSGSAEWRYHLQVEAAGMMLRLGRFDRCLDHVREARASGPVREDRERPYALGWIEVLACHGWRNESLFDSRSRSWGNALRAGRGRHWPSERLFLQGLRKTLFLDGRRRREALAELRQALRPTEASWRWPTRHLDLLGWLDRAIDGAVQRA